MKIRRHVALDKPAPSQHAERHDRDRTSQQRGGYGEPKPPMLRQIALANGLSKADRTHDEPGDHQNERHGAQGPAGD